VAGSSSRHIHFLLPSIYSLGPLTARAWITMRVLKQGLTMLAVPHIKLTLSHELFNFQLTELERLRTERDVIMLHRIIGAEHNHVIVVIPRSRKKTPLENLRAAYARRFRASNLRVEVVGR